VRYNDSVVIGVGTGGHFLSCTPCGFLVSHKIDYQIFWDGLEILEYIKVK